MLTVTSARSLPVLFAGVLLLVACSDEPGSASSVALDGAGVESAEDDPPAGDEAGDATEPSAEDSDDGSGTEGQQESPAADDGSGLVDLTEAVPGTWPVGDAGTVTFAIGDGALVLEDVTAADGWRADIDEQDPDEIEVDFRRDGVAWQIEIELEDGGTILEIEIDLDIDDAEPGSYDLGDAGTFSFDVQDGRLVVTDLNVADGWTVTGLDEEADEIEFELVNGPREFDVEVELEDDGTIDLDIDYEVVGPVTG
jgi:hypothetical protein